ncbi:MAG: DNA-3-methyladenine glycosylase 2 family protein [Firmicutes bacterium]|nr:DNA-3-methyladenine glycosylase 2 family protein [Bacillota bacterium]
MSETYFIYGEVELAHLRKKCKKLAALIDRVGMIKRPVNPNPFSALVESIVAQQISTKAAATVTARLRELSAMDADRLNALSAEEIQACGMSMQKAGYIKNIAAAAVTKAVDFDTLADKTDREIIDALVKIKGIGVWTAEMLLIFSLTRPNVVSYGDLIIRCSIMQLYGHKELPKERFMRYAKRYAPYGSVASLYLWALANLTACP